MRHLPLALLAALILWAPIPFGSVTPWGVVVLIAGVSLVTLSVAATGKVALGDRRGVVLGLAGLGALGFGQAAAGLSLAPVLSRQAAVGWWTLALLFVAAMQIAGRPRARPVLLVAVLTATAFQVVYGGRQLVRDPYSIWGRAAGGPGRFRGTLVNSDHLAVWLEVVMAICLAWTWWAWRRSRREPRFVYRLAWLAPPIACWLGSARAVVATGSRAALAAVVLGAVFQVALLVAPSGRWWMSAALLGAVFVGGVAVVARGPAPDLGRQLSRPLHEVVASERFAVWGPSFELWRGAPLLGTGLGTFEEAFPRVQPPELQRNRWGRAHNDPLELLVTGGLVGVGLLAWALWILARRLWAVYRSGTLPAARAAALAGLAALAPVTLHEGVDFGLTVPANAVLLTVLLAVGAAGPTAAERGAAPLRSPYGRPPRPGSRARGGAAQPVR
ncbi:MAG: O-antigen ligase family protein [Acidobacteriota bacterium]|nr:O-antigen ligase family protein [Acidobacteriota bacterium]MDH3524662.1 O-antigen ligase family protein [Acidobacteriota bacterium]